MPKPTAPQKSAKPYPDFPLTPHPSGRWCKKVLGKIHYFGAIGDPDAALNKWEKQRDYLLTGRKPPTNLDGLTLKALANEFLTFKKSRVVSGELTAGTWTEYKAACAKMIAAFGPGRIVADLDANDFIKLRERLGKGCGLVSLAGRIRRAKVVFKWGYESGLLDRPPRYGQAFAPPNRAAMRKERAAKGRQDFTADEIRAMLAAANDKGKHGLHLKAFILLGLNCGLGTSDIGNMPQTALDLDGGWLDYARAKTGIGRRCKLWPETVNAVQAALGKRHRPKTEAAEKLAFLTPHGHAYFRYRGDSCSVNGIAGPFKLLCTAANVKRGERGFYSLRRTLATVGDEARDPVALRHILGHAAPSSDMGDVYRQTIGDERLQRVVDHVRGWLFPPEPAKARVARKRKGK